MRTEEIMLEKRYHYNNKLNPEEQRFYRIMLDLIVHGEYRFFYISAPEDIPEEFRSYPIIEPTESTKDGDIYRAYYAISDDFPELYYLDTSLHFNFEHGYYFMEPYLEQQRYSRSQIEKLNKKLDKIYHKFDKIEAGFPLELAVNNYLIKNFEYEDGHESMRTRIGFEKHTIAGLLKRGRAVCSAYSKLAQYIFLRRGMDAVYLYSEPDGDCDKTHAWLAVKIEGQYYHLDITYDDSTSGVEYIVHYGNFNITDKERIKSLPPGNRYSPEDWPGIVCNSKKQNYFYRMNLYFKSTDELLRHFIPFCEKNRGRRGFFGFYFRRSRNVRTKDIYSTMEALDKQKYGIDKLIYQTNYGYGVILFSYTKGGG